MLNSVMAALMVLPGVTDPGAAVTGHAWIQKHDPESSFEFIVNACGDRGMFRLAHHYQGDSAWLTGAVDCVRAGGGFGVVTGTVAEVRGVGGVAPGDRFSLSVLDRGGRDLLGMAWKDEAARCLGPAPDQVITGGDLRVRD